jgi:predicted alpha/beta superfamily hydrolase
MDASKAKGREEEEGSRSSSSSSSSPAGSEEEESEEERAKKEALLKARQDLEDKKAKIQEKLIVLREKSPSKHHLSLIFVNVL